ncbi:MAG TPA: LCP family protein, partial [Acidimicrobiales bacterium]
MGTERYASAHGARLRRTWPQRFVIVCGMALVVLSLASAWGLSEVYNSVGEIQRYVVAPDLLDENVDPGGPRNVLLIGSTETEGLDEGDAILTARGNERLADTIMLLRIDPAAREAAVMSINRDLYIPNIAGYAGKINGAYSVGNVDLLLEVIQEYLDVPI